MKTHARGRRRGLTLIEVMISVSVLGMIAMIIYGAFSVVHQGRQVAGQLAERHRLARVVLDRMTRELSTAYLSNHNALTVQQNVRNTAFYGSNKRVDFNAFSHVRLVRDAHESDQCEVSYFAAGNRKKASQLDLVRREQVIADTEPGKGGVVNVLVDDIDTFQLRYLDPMSGMWTDTWDSTSVSGQPGRVPMQVEVFLVMKGGPAGEPIRLRTRIPLMILQPLTFALRR